MEKNKENALFLRKQGKSYNQISQELGIAKSTLSYWFKGLEWSADISLQLTEEERKSATLRIKKFHEVRKARLDQLYSSMRKQAVREFQYFKANPLFITGVAIYWGEGDKTSLGQVRISNRDPQLTSVFRDFLLFCRVHPSKMRAWLLLYPDLKEDECKQYWVQNGLKDVKFIKSIYIKGRHKKKILSYGVCNLGISSRTFKEKMLVWLQLLPKEAALQKENSEHADIV